MMCYLDLCNSSDIFEFLRPLLPKLRSWDHGILFFQVNIQNGLQKSGPQILVSGLIGLNLGPMVPNGVYPVETAELVGDHEPHPVQ